MSYEVLIKRIIYVAKCDGCGGSEEKTENPPRERWCTQCSKWVPYKEESFTGPSLDGKKVV